MDKKLRELLETVLAERFELAFVRMREESPADADAVAELVRLSDAVEHHPGVSREARELVREFLSADADNNTRFQKYLYIQGAKDCAAALKELDLIKTK